MPTPLARWDHIHDLHRWYAELDAPDPRPHLVAFAGDHAMVLIGLRPFPPGGYRGPLVEALALALPLGADRVSVALPGRAWSLDDPIVPVSDAGDMRQRVLTQVTVDGHGRATPTTTMRLHPFRVSADDSVTITWQPATDPGPGDGWIPGALGAMVAGRERIGVDATDDDLAQQLRRLDHLGHEVLFPDHVAATLPP